MSFTTQGTNLILPHVIHYGVTYTALITVTTFGPRSFYTVSLHLQTFIRLNSSQHQFDGFFFITGGCSAGFSADIVGIIVGNFKNNEGSDLRLHVRRKNI